MLELQDEKVGLAYVEEIKVLKGGWTRRRGIRGRVRGGWKMGCVGRSYGDPEYNLIPVPR